MFYSAGNSAQMLRRTCHQGALLCICLCHCAWVGMCGGSGWTTVAGTSVRCRGWARVGSCLCSD